MRIIVISNGYGEDHIAKNLVLAARMFFPTGELSALPLVGEGIIYKNNNIPCLLTNPVFPSGGFIRDPLTLIQDMKAGLLNNWVKQYRFLKNYNQTSHHVIAVGDIFALLMASLAPAKHIHFLPTAKSNRFMNHSAIELRLLKKIASSIYPRDRETHACFTSRALPSFYFGNPMMDDLKHSAKTSPLFQGVYTKWKTPFSQIVGLLPGSRKEAEDNLVYILEVVAKYYQTTKKIGFLLCLAESFNLSDFIKKCPNEWKLSKTAGIHFLQHIEGKHKILITSQFPLVLSQSKCFIGLAGTANEQACYINKEVIAFKGFGPQSTAKRFEEQSRLIGPNLIYIRNHTREKICRALTLALQRQSKPKNIPEYLEASKQIMANISKFTDIY